MVYGLGLLAGVFDCTFAGAEHHWASLVVAVLATLYVLGATIVKGDDLDDSDDNWY